VGDTTAESGGNAGSHFAIHRYADAGGWNGTPLTINRQTGIVSTATAAYIPGIFCRTGISGAYKSSTFTIDWTSIPTLWIDAVNIGQIAITSDYRIKRDIADLSSMWERAKALRPISYTQAEYTPKDATEPMFLADDVERWGFIAHELQETLIPSAATGVKDEDNVIQSPNLWTVLATVTKALQEAMARIEALEGAT
jgi:hypothetical protein